MGSLASCCCLLILLLLLVPISAKSPKAPRNCEGAGTAAATPSRNHRTKAQAPAVLAVPSGNASTSVTRRDDFSPASAPVESDSAAGSSRSSRSGSSSSSSSSPSGTIKPPLPHPNLKGPLPPLPKPGDHPLPIPPKPKNDPTARSSSSSSSTPVRASSPEVLLAAPTLSPFSSEQISPSQTQPVSGGVTNVEVPVPAPSLTVAAAPAPRQASQPFKIPAKVLIRGQVMCKRCKTRKKSRGISGVTVQLTCSSVVLTTVTDHHGKFKIDFRHTIPMGFSRSCMVTVQNSTLPNTCNIPDSSAQEHHALVEYSSHHSIHYYVNPFTYTPVTSSRHCADSDIP